MKNRLIQTITLSSLLISSIFASDISINSLGINLGKAYTSYDQKNISGTITFTNKPESSFNAIELYTTLNPILNICIENNMKPTISYTYSSNSDLKHQYLLVGINKYYTPIDKFTLYTGILGGYGQIDWRYDPLNNSAKKNVDANSFITGLQVGVNYPLNEKLSLGVNTKYLFHNYETNLKTTTVTATIEHDNSANISLGVEYSF
jgi:hypothetical protein